MKKMKKPNPMLFKFDDMYRNQPYDFSVSETITMLIEESFCEIENSGDILTPEYKKFKKFILDNRYQIPDMLKS